ncbi:MAG: hypothetical protein CMJ27_06845 [Phycisphaerae bacterium]|nr:hypothetical protein [Phycisphaerae bacterium]
MVGTDDVMQGNRKELLTGVLSLLLLWTGIGELHAFSPEPPVLGRFERQIDGLDESRAIALRPNGSVVVVDAWGRIGASEAAGAAMEPPAGGCVDLAIDGEDRWFLLGPRNVERRDAGKDLAWSTALGGVAVGSGGGTVWIADARGKLHGLDLETGAPRSVGESVYPGCRGIAGLPDGGAWLADTDRHRLVRIDATGAEVRSIGDRGAFPGLFNTPVDLAIAGERLFVADKSNHRISVHRLEDGAFLDQWGMHAVIPREGEGRIHYPEGVAISADGRTAFVLEPFERRYQVFGPVPDGESPTGGSLPRIRGVESHFGTGVGADRDLLAMWEPESASAVVFDLRFGIPIHVTTFSRSGRGAAHFNRIDALGVDAAAQEIFLLDGGSRRIVKWRLDRDREAPLKMDPFMARFVRSWRYDLLDRRVAAAGGGGAVDLRDLVIRDRVLHLLDASGPSIILADGDLDVSRVISLPTDARPVQIAVRPTGGWLVSDADAGRVLVLDAAGVVERSLGVEETGVERPFGVAALSDGRIAISDRGMDRMVTVSSDGEVVSTAGERGSWDGALWLPAGLEVLPDGGVVVLDQGNHRAQVFDAVSGDWKISFSLGQGHDRPMLLRSDFEPAGEVVPATSVEAGDGADAMRPSPSEDQP